MNFNSDLYAKYEKTRSNHFYSGENAQKAYNTILVLFLLTALSGVKTLFSIETEDDQWYFILLLLEVIYKVVLSISIISAYHEGKRSNAEFRIRNGIYAHLRPNTVAELKELIREPCEIMKLRFDKIEFLKTYSHTYLPSLDATSKNRYYIIIPLNFLVLLRENKNEGRALLLHELGHVKQKDGLVWNAVNSWIPIVRRFVYPVVIVLLILTIIFTTLTIIMLFQEGFSVFELVIFSLIPLLVIYAYAQIISSVNSFKNGRLNSEKLADLIPIIFGLKESLISSFKTYFADKQSEHHPEINTRIEAINDLSEEKSSAQLIDNRIESI